MFPSLPQQPTVPLASAQVVGTPPDDEPPLLVPPEDEPPLLVPPDDEPPLLDPAWPQLAVDPHAPLAGTHELTVSPSTVASEQQT